MATFDFHFPMLHFLPRKSCLFLSAAVALSFLNRSALAALPIAAATPATATKAGDLTWDAKTQGSFVTSVARGRDGQIWVGVEDNGVWRFDPLSGKWTQWTAQAALSDINTPSYQADEHNHPVGLGDNNAYALAIDSKGRVWAAQRNHGVAVWNGKQWRYYGAEEGPLGERVFDIKICPRDGAVWMATSCGLARYSVQKDSWRYFTRTDGLPSDQIQALAFDKAGNVVVGTQCDGLALANFADGYAKWRVVSGPATPGYTPTGKGLPSSLINDVLVTRDGTIYAATNCGLAQSRDKGQSWEYARGRDYADKVRGRASGLPFARWTEKPGATLAEDYVACLAEDAQGLLWVGHRQQPYEVFDPKTQARVWSGERDPAPHADNYVTRILPMPDSAPLIARYGGGLTCSEKPVKSSSDRLSSSVSTPSSTRLSVQKSNMPPAFPLPAAPPTIEELTAMLKRIKALTPTKATPAKAVPAKAVPAKEKASAAYLNDDWATMGDWVGRYGRQFGLLWAIEAPYSNSYGSSLYLPAPKGHIYWVEARIGTNRDKDDALRHWKHWLKTDNPNVLYYPDAGYRRETEIDDHGEGYPQWHEGPDIWMLVDVPEGMQRMSLYFFNKDGHEDANRYRNYTVEVRECLSDTTRFHAERFWSPGWNPSGTQVEQFSDYQIKLASKQPVLASARVRDFWGGVYKSFAVSGGHFYWVKIAKNDSQNVICQSIFLDHLKLPVADKEGDWDTEYSTNMDPHFPPDLQVEISYLVEKDAKGQPMRRLEYTSLKDVQTNDPKVPLRLRLAMHLWKAVDDASESPQVALLQRRARLMAYRVVYDADKNQPTTWSAGEAPKYRVYAGEALKNWSWHLGLWSPLAGDDRKNFRDVMATAWDNYATINPDERKDYAH